MKGKKCIRLLILCIICLLSLNLFSNASAIEIQQSMINIKSINHTFFPSNTNLSSNLNNNFAPTLYFAPTAGQVQSMRSLVMNLYSPTEFSKTNKFKLKIYFKISFKDSASFTMALPNCPPGSNGFRIYECNVEQLDQTTVLQQLNQYPGPGTGSYLYYWSAITETDVYYVMNLKGYLNTNSLVSRNEINTDGSFFLVKNTDSALTSDVSVDIFFTPVIVFIDEESPSDKAAEKELEDRDNLESQSTSTDNQANNAAQSAENTGSTLFAAFTQFFNALTNVSGSSCVLPNMQVYSLNLGQMNLCTFDIPPQIMALVSVGMVFIIVPLGIHLVKKMINLYKEITG